MSVGEVAPGGGIFGDGRGVRVLWTLPFLPSLFLSVFLVLRCTLVTFRVASDGTCDDAIGQ